MGSILSFPVLCTINAAVLRWVSELCRFRRLSLAEAHIAVNGDDGLIRARGRAFSYLTEVAAFVGLPLSVGKVYESREFFDMNSRVFLVTTDARTGKNLFDEVPFVQLRMLSGLTRSGVPPGPVWERGKRTTRRDDRADVGVRQFRIARLIASRDDLPCRDFLRQGLTPSRSTLRKWSSLDPALGELLMSMEKWTGVEQRADSAWFVGDNGLFPTGETVTTFLRQAPVELRAPLYAEFCARHKRTLPRGIPWFVPTVLGGLGLPVLWSDGTVGGSADFSLSLFNGELTEVPRVLFGPSDLDRKIATVIRNRLICGKLRPFDYRSEPEWRIRSTARQLLPRAQLVVDFPSDRQRQLTARVDAILTMETYLTCPLSDLFHPSEPSRDEEPRAELPPALYEAQKAWRPRNFTSLPVHGLGLTTMWERHRLVTVTPVSRIVSIF
jgi:hypothetical protein